MLPQQPAMRCLRGRKSIVSLLTGRSVFSGTGIECFPDSRPCGVCGDASRLCPCYPALRSFRARETHASPTTGPAVFAGPQLLCVSANRPFVFFGHGHRMLSDNRPCCVCGAAIRFRHCYPALRSFRGGASYATPTTGPAVFAVTQLNCVPAKGPSDFSGAHIACFPGSRPCGLCGAAPLVYIHLGS